MALASHQWHTSLLRRDTFAELSKGHTLANEIVNARAQEVVILSEATREARNE